METKRTLLLLGILWFSSLSIAAQNQQELNDQMFEAVRVGDAVRVAALLDKGADVNAKFRYGTTALFKAAERGHLEVARLLIARGVDVTVKDSFYGSNAISWALQNDHFDVVKVILAKDTGSVDDVLLAGVRSGTQSLVEIALAQSGSKSETMTTALAVAAGDKEKAALAELLKKAGASPPPEIDAATLQSYLGNYKSEQGSVMTITVKDGKLSAQSQGQQVITLIAVDKTTFRPIEFDGMVFTIKLEANRVESLVLKRGTSSTTYKRVD